jgi:two-component system OmpR family sensor kinase
VNALPSIRQRLGRSLVGISAAWGLAVSAVVWLSVQHEVDELLDSTLQESAEILFGLLTFHAGQLPLQGGGALPAPVHDEQLVWQIVSPERQVLLRSHRAPDGPLLASAQPGFGSVADAWRVYAMPFGAPGGVLYVAQRDSARREAQFDAAAITAGAALAVGLLCAVWLRARVRRELATVAELSEAVARYDPVNGSAQLAKARRAELVPMHHAITDLGARLAQRLANERAFTAHAAHALRTPLAGMVAQLAVAQRELPPEAQPRLQRTREAADRLRRVVNALLTLFRAGAEPKWQAVDLAALVSHLPFEGLAVTVSGTPRLQADPDLLAAALLNLLDNAQRHGAGQVTVSVAAPAPASDAATAPAQPGLDAATRITLQDDGSGLPEAHRLRLQAALDAQDYDGTTGLGLMLADRVARAHGGSLHLLPVAVGCCVQLRVGPAPASA